MNTLLRALPLVLFIGLISSPASAQSWWSPATPAQTAGLNGERQIRPSDYQLIQIDLEALKTRLSGAPLWHTPAAAAGSVTLEMPMPDGRLLTLEIVEAPVMSEGLAEKYPGMRSYAASSPEDGTAYARLGYSHKGFHAMILSSRHPTVFVDLYKTGQTQFYQVYYKSEVAPPPSPTFSCGLEAAHGAAPPDVEAGATALGDCTLRTYELALACTGEYAQFHGNTVADVMAAFNVAMARVNGVFERDFTVHMELIDNTDELIFLNPSTDPYTNNSASAMLSENQQTIDAAIGSNNYDIGHVFSTGGGGVAFLASVCGSSKAGGVTGQAAPINDPFYIDYVAHEMGHQFGANHTQNNGCNRVGFAAMEPGSASTIMGYAGICSPNVQDNSDDYFHAISILEVTEFLEQGNGGACAETTLTGNLGPDVSTAAGSYVLPVSTPFFLTAQATDGNGDDLTYCWEQMDSEVATMPPVPTSSGGPAFRSLLPTASPTRYFPNLPALASNTPQAWEVLPAVSRDMNFRCTVRDNAPGGGCTRSTDVELSFSDDAGPFVVTQPNTQVTWIVESLETITWEVAGTDAPPVNCPFVDIYLSKDGGLTYPFLLADGVPNNGSATVEVPDEVTPNARIQVVGAGHIFFDISDEDFAIEQAPSPSFGLGLAPAAQRVCSDSTAVFEISTNAIAGFDEELQLSLLDPPAGLTAEFSAGTLPVGGSATLTLSSLEALAPGLYELEIEAAGDTLVKTQTVTLDIAAGVPAAVALAGPADGAAAVDVSETPLSWEPAPGAYAYRIEIAVSPAFGPSVVETDTVAATAYQPAQLDGLSVYYWRVAPLNACGEGPPSATAAFQTRQVTCLLFEEVDPGLPIPADEPGTNSTTLELSDDFPILSVRASLEVAHSYIGDLSATLSHAAGPSVPLFDRPGVPASNFGCGEDDLLLTFGDEAGATADDLENTCNVGTDYAIAGDFQPLGALSDFAGLSAAGPWTLSITDGAFQDGGFLVRWSLEVCREADLLFPADTLVHLPLPVPFGAEETITADYLAYTKPGLDANQLIYRLTELPAHGTLLLSPGMAPLEIGAAFTQSDLDEGRLVYAHDASASATDAFRFDLSDTEGGWRPNQVFLFQIDQPTALSGSAEVTSPISCAGSADGALSVTLSGGLPPFTYQLNEAPPQGSPDFTGLAAGDYTIAVMDQSGQMIALGPFSLSAPDPLVLSAETAGNTLHLQATGGTPPYAYSLDGGNTFSDTTTFAGLDNGSYNLLVQDERGCTRSLVFDLNLLVSAVAATVAVNCAGGADGRIAVSGIEGGVSPYTYALNGGVGQSSPEFTDLPAGAYTILITDANGSTLLLEEVVAEPPPLGLDAAGSGGSLTLTASGGVPPYEYSIDGGSTFSGQAVYDGLDMGTYDLVAQDANGCTATAAIMLSPISNAAVEVADANCANMADGAITVQSVDGGFAPYTYQLNEGPAQSSPAFNGLLPGVYELTVTDAEGNSIVVPGIVVDAPAPLMLEATVEGNQLLLQGSGGVPPYQYSINGGMSFTPDSSFTGLPDGAYTLVLLDDNECFAAGSATISLLAGATPAVTNVSCAGAADGRIEVASVEGGVPPFQYRLNGGPFQDSPLFEPLAPGIYSIQVTDANGQSLELPGLQVNAPEVLNVDVIRENNNLSLVASGGTPPYQYSIDGGQNFSDMPDFEGLPNGTYNLLVRDANSCTVSSSATINILVSGAAAINPVSCAGGADGAISVTVVEGGVPPYAFSLNGGLQQGNPTFEGLIAGVYTIQITDANGSSIELDNLAVGSPDPLELTPVLVGNNLDLEVAGGTPPYSYSIDGGATFSGSPGFEGLANGTYDIVVQDANGCTLSLPIEVNLILDAQLDIEHLSCAGAGDGRVEVLAVEGGTQPYTYRLNEGVVQDSPLFEGLAAGAYELVIEDAAGQVLAVSFDLEAPDPVVLSGTVTENNLSLEASGGQPPYLFSIDGGLTFSADSAYTDLPNGDYGLQAQDANGCLSPVDTVTILMSGAVSWPGHWSVRLSPNPASGPVWLEGKGFGAQEVEWMVISPLGQVLKSGRLPVLSGRWLARLDLSGLPAGGYWIRIVAEGRSGVLPVVVW